MFCTGLCYDEIMDKFRALVSEELSVIDDNLDNIIEQDDCVFPDLRSFLSGNSKRIRSVICLLYLKSQGIDITNKITDFLVAVELIHNASLLHDDFVDNSDIRRGVPTLFKKYGSKLSVLSGDYLLSLAVERLIRLQNFDILTLFSDTVKKMSEAEITQYCSRNNEISFDEYLKIVTGKTAALFSSCIKSAAMLSGINCERAFRFGEKFGILFQINNDFDSDSAENDRFNGVKTAVSIIGIEKTLVFKDNYKEELRQILAEIPDNIYKKGIEDLIELL